jgi:hypothetical protein
MANQQNSYGYQRGQQIHLHFHAAPQAAPQPQQPAQPQTQTRQIPSAEAIDAQFALIMRTVVTVIVGMWVIMIPYMAIPFGAAAIFYFLRGIRKSQPAIGNGATQAANNALGLGAPAATQTPSSLQKRSVSAPTLGQLRKRLPAPLKRLPRP